MPERCVSKIRMVASTSHQLLIGRRFLMNVLILLFIASAILEIESP